MNLAEDLVDKCKDLIFNLNDIVAQQNMGMAILNLLRNKKSQNIIDMALSKALNEDESLYNLLRSHLEWHICHQVTSIKNKGQFFLSQVLVPITVLNYDKSIDPEISGFVIENIAKEFLRLLDMPDGSIVIFNEYLHRGEDLRGGHIKRFNMPAQMNSNKWEHAYNNLILPENGAVLYLYAMILEPISEHQVSLCIDKSLTSPSRTYEWRRRCQCFLSAQFKARGESCEIMVGNPSSYSVGLNQSAGYLKVLSTANTIKTYINGFLPDDSVVVINEAPLTKEISIQFYDDNICHGVLSYGKPVFNSGIGCNEAFFDREWLKECLIDIGFNNVVMDNKNVDHNDVSDLLSSSRLKVL